jgi:hypothetical protein
MPGIVIDHAAYMASRVACSSIAICADALEMLTTSTSEAMRDTCALVVQLCLACAHVYVTVCSQSSHQLMMHAAVMIHSV